MCTVQDKIRCRHQKAHHKNTYKKLYHSDLESRNDANQTKVIKQAKIQFNLQKKPHIEVQNKSTIIRITPRNQRRSMINESKMINDQNLLIMRQCASRVPCCIDILLYHVSTHVLMRHVCCTEPTCIWAYSMSIEPSILLLHQGFGLLYGIYSFCLEPTCVVKNLKLLHIMGFLLEFYNVMKIILIRT